MVFLNLLRILLYFPSVTFSLFSAEIFPYGIINSFLNGLVLNKKILAFFLIILLSAIHGIYIHNSFNFDIFRSIAAYMNPVMIYFVVKNSDSDTVDKMLKINRGVLFFFFILGFLQITGITTLMGFSQLISFLMNRGADGLIGEGRGISLLASEPSRASYEVLFVYMLFRATTKIKAPITVIFDIAIAFFILFFIRSAMGAIFLLIFIFFNYKKYFIICLPFLSLFVGFVNGLDSESRAIQLFLSGLEALKNGEFINLFLSASGFRGISVYAGYLSGLKHPFGLGVGYWETSSILALRDTGFSALDITYFATREGVYESVRPTSFISSLMLDTGIIGVFITILLIKDAFFVAYDDLTKSIVYCFIFYLFFIGSIGNPIPWLVVGLLIAYKFKYNKDLA